MKDFFSRLLKKLKAPSGVVAFLDIFLFFISLALTVFFLVTGNESPVVYAVYAIAAITLFYGAYICILFFPTVRDKIKAALLSNKITKKMMSQYDFRTVILSTVSLFVNIAYAAVTLIVGIFSRSELYIAFSCYYISLIILRGAAVLLYKNSSGDELIVKSIKKYRFCGAMLVIFPIALLPFIIHSLIFDITLIYSEIIIFAVAAYAFFKITVAIINFIKAKKSGDLIVRSLRNVNLSDAMMTLFMLQVALINMFSAVGDMSYMNLITGGAVCFITIAMGIYMIKFSSAKIKQLKDEKNEQ